MDTRCRRVCLFGGSFDPVHAGHLHIAAAAKEECGLDELIFLPAARSPFKQEQNTLFTDEQRLELLQLAVKDYSWAGVSALDLELPPPSWSWRLVEHYHHTFPRAELYWLMGTDQWQQLHRWARYDYLCRHLHFIVYHRGEAPQPREGAHATFISGNHPASSTAIRLALQTGSDLSADWLPPAVEQRALDILARRSGN